MMTERVSKLFKSAMSDDLFLKEIKEADGDTKPNKYSDNIEKHLFAMAYYGWLVGKYGKDWEKHLKQ